MITSLMIVRLGRHSFLKESVHAISLSWVICIVVALVLPNIGQAQQPLTVEAFGRLPDVSQVELSPDGSKVFSLVRYEYEGTKGTVLHLVDIQKNNKKILLSTDNSKFVIGWARWANDRTLLLSTHYPSKIYRTPLTATRLLRIDITTGEVRSAIPARLFNKLGYLPTVQDRIVDMLVDQEDEFLLSLRPNNLVASEVYRINHKTNRYKRVHRSRPRTLSWMTDRQHTLRIARYFDETTIRYDHKANEGSKWNTLFEYEVFSDSEKRPLGFDRDPNILYFLALHDGRKAVFKMNVSEPDVEPELIYSHPKYDVSGTLVYSQKNNRVVGIRYSLGKGYAFWDAEYSSLQKSLNKVLKDTNNKIVNFSHDERRAIVLSTSDVDAGTYYYWDRDNGAIYPIASRYKALDPARMADKRYISYRARDGLSIYGYLTKPNHKDNTPGPTIIFPHGGPNTFDDASFDYWTQYFAYKGYNVLQMNFRGSSGYGHDFMTAGIKGWGGKMQSDVEDGTRWLIADGIADPHKICIVGASYGGYAALMEAANNPELYQCAVSFAGVTDLPSLVSHSKKFLNHKVIKEYIGSNVRELKERSPTHRAAEIDIPTLIVHGTKDRVVPISQGRRMHKKLSKARKNVSYVELKDGTHYLSNEEHRLTFFKKMDAFLTKHLQ